MKFALCPAHQPHLGKYQVDQGKGQWEHQLGLPRNLDMLVLAESDLFYSVHNICLCIPEKKRVGGRRVEREQTVSIKYNPN